MLEESAPIYRGLSAADALWLRGNVLAGLARVSAPLESLNLAIEELRFGHDVTVLAGAARLVAAQGLDHPQARDAANRARSRISGRDAFPDLGPGIGPENSCDKRTVVEELDRLLGLLPASTGNSCGCSSKQPGEALDLPEKLELPAALFASKLQDQHAAPGSLNDLAANQPAILTLFYTRCLNPLKCSLAISRLGQAVAALPELGWFGLSYDPAFDTAERLRAYGDDRNFPFAERARLLRCTRGWSGLRQALGLRVGYGETTVNTHARELFLLMPNGDAWRIPADWLSEPDRIADFLQRMSP